MKRKILWLGLSWLIVAALLLASCGPAATEEEEEVVTEEEEVEREVITVNSDEVPVLSIGQTAFVKAAEIPKLHEGLTVEQRAEQTAKLEITVSDVTVTDSYEYFAEFAGKIMPKEAGTGNTFVIAYVKIENMKAPGEDFEMYQGAKRLHVVDSDGNEYVVGVYYGGDEIIGGKDLMPEEIVEGWVSFTIPEAATGVKIFYKFYFPEVKVVEWAIE